MTIGYDAPWRKVHELLIAAAVRTEGVLEDPPPFVLQTTLNDFSVAYEINAFVASPIPLPLTYSALHANIQECFNTAGVEIMSPNYFALRNSNRVAIPRPHLPPDYVSAGVSGAVRGARDVPNVGDTAKNADDRAFNPAEGPRNRSGPRETGG